MRWCQVDSAAVCDGWHELEAFFNDGSGEDLLAANEEYVLTLNQHYDVGEYPINELLTA